MNDSITWVGMDVHKDSLVVAAVDGKSGSLLWRAEYPNSDKGVRRLVVQLKKSDSPRSVYEAGPCGYHVRRVLQSHGIACDVIAPALIPRKPGDRVKTDRRDAEKLARMHRMGELTTVHVPTPAQEALRDLVRTREDAMEDLLRHRHRLSKFLLRHGLRFEGRSWTKSHRLWLRSHKFEDGNLETVFTEYLLSVEQEEDRLRRLDRRIEEESLRPDIADVVARLKTLRGIQTLTAMTLISELIDLRRFAHPRELMAFVGLVPSERSSGGRERRGSITKTGNTHVRRVLLEAAWHYRHPYRGGGKAILRRRKDQPPAIVEVARKADLRLHKKYFRLVLKGKRTPVAATAVARELAGFVWAAGRA
jgi:transposase